MRGYEACSNDYQTKAIEEHCVTAAVLKITLIIRSDDQVFSISSSFKTSSFLISNMVLTLIGLCFSIDSLLAASAARLEEERVQLQLTREDIPSSMQAYYVFLRVEMCWET
jgi:hypothetical protein